MCPDGSEPPNTETQVGDFTCGEIAALAKTQAPDSETCGRIKAGNAPFACGCPGAVPVEPVQNPCSELSAAHFYSYGSCSCAPMLILAA